MKTINVFLFLSLCLCNQLIFAQKDFNDYALFYPIGEDPNIRILSSYVKDETILFEAEPNMKYNLYNDFLKGLMDGEKYTKAYYISMKPHLRMYTDNSLPVKMPSYRVFLGTQQLFRLSNNRFLSFSLESGHYSNGQSGCAFSEIYEDGSVECENVYSTIDDQTNLSSLLNRKNGNYSTNLTELRTNYRLNKLDEDDIPYLIHSFDVGYLLYHDKFLGLGNFGGYSDNDIKLYGRHRFLFRYDYHLVLGKGKSIAVSNDLEIIAGAHKSINPI
ncbi:MAG: hypothetical protein OEW75_13415, partial [Cyclobacteriaceae bacterium]|nr:hypothetical protein [Cyclobacteriaceae bacterium]